MNTGFDGHVGRGLVVPALGVHCWRIRWKGSEQRVENRK